MKGKKMKANWVLGAAFAAAVFSAPAFGQVSIGVTIGTPPPPVRYEVAPPPPQVDYVWVPGYWVASGPRYVWAPGRWMQPPYPGAMWHAARWDHEDRGYRYHEGYWEHPRGKHDRDDDDDHHGNGHAYGHYKHGHDRD